MSIRFWGHSFKRSVDEVVSALEQFGIELVFRRYKFEHKTSVLREGAIILRALAKELEAIADKEDEDAILSVMQGKLQES